MAYRMDGATISVSRSSAPLPHGLESMRKSILAISFLAAIAATSAHASGASNQLNNADVIQGMGERVPAGKKNVNLSRCLKSTPSKRRV